MTVFPFIFPAVFGDTAPAAPAIPKMPSIEKYSRDWTVFDPNLRIDTHAHETAYIVVVTYLPTGQQETCGRYPYPAQNRAAAIAKLKSKIGM